MRLFRPRNTTVHRLSDINADTITQAVIARHARADDARLRELMTSLVQHLHAFAREVRLSEAELGHALAFLAEAGRRSGEGGAGHEELALLSDTLGLSMLVAALGDSLARQGTVATLCQPLQREAAPPCEAGAWLKPARAGATLHVRGRVAGPEGAALPGAVVEVWQPGAAGRFGCDAQGRYRFRTECPQPTQLPHDGPVGGLLVALGRRTWRPAHLQFRVSAPGHRTLATHVFRDGSPHLDDDAAFAVRRSLVAPWTEHPPGPTPDGGVSAEPFYTLDFEFRLAAEAAAPARRAA